MNILILTCSNAGLEVQPVVYLRLIYSKLDGTSNYATTDFSHVITNSEDYIIATWAQEDVETLYNLPNK